MRNGSASQDGSSWTSSSTLSRHQIAARRDRGDGISTGQCGGDRRGAVEEQVSGHK